MIPSCSKFCSVFGAGNLSKDEKSPFALCGWVRERLVVKVVVAPGSDDEMFWEFAIT